MDGVCGRAVGDEVATGAASGCVGCVFTRGGLMRGRAVIMMSTGGLLLPSLSSTGTTGPGPIGTALDIGVWCFPNTDEPPGPT